MLTNTRRWISHRLDMLAYRFFYARWQPLLEKHPQMIVPFAYSFTRWMERELTAGEIEECRAYWCTVMEKDRK